jgi:Trypsin
MENVDLLAQMWQCFAEWKLGHLRRALCRQCSSIRLASPFGRVRFVDWGRTVRLSRKTSSDCRFTSSIRPENFWVRFGFVEVQLRIQINFFEIMSDGESSSRFYEPVVFQPNIIPVCVPEKDEDFIGRTAFVTGWGRLYEGMELCVELLLNNWWTFWYFLDGPLPSVLQEVTVPIIKNDICESMYRNAGYIEHIPHIFICAGHKQGSKDSCEGDSGGNENALLGFWEFVNWSQFAFQVQWSSSDRINVSNLLESFHGVKLITSHFWNDDKF